jgi:HEPN domain-containing protein
MTDRPQTDSRQWFEATRWLVYVDQDLFAVEALLAVPERGLIPAAFHCQQAAEKMAKAILIVLGASPPKIHDVAELAELVYERSPAVGEMVREVGRFSVWYLASRYPDAQDNFSPTAHEIKLALLKLKELRRRIDLLAPKAQ